MNYEELREKIARFHADVASRNYTKLGIKAHQCTPIWVADQILSIIREEIKGIENPFVGYIDVVENIRMAKEQGFERFRQTIIEVLGGE